jgi:DNA helicase-2/ATP-dependent DNA helicase PcrA
MTTIQPHPDAKDGEVVRLAQYDVSNFPKGSLILCRNTAPLVAFAYGLLQRDVPCRILGKDIGKQLADIVKKRRAVHLDDLKDKLKTWADRETAAAIQRDQSPERIWDQYECLMFFISGLDDDSRTIDSLLAKIDLMFTDDTNGGSASRITLSTVHKAKGLEFPTVFILDKEKYMPSRYAKQPWQLTQERNLIYVAVTRAMERLVYINSDSWKE